MVSEQHSADFPDSDPIDRRQTNKPKKAPPPATPPARRPSRAELIRRARSAVSDLNAPTRTRPTEFDQVPCPVLRDHHGRHRGVPAGHDGVSRAVLLGRAGDGSRRGNQRRGPVVGGGRDRLGYRCRDKPGGVPRSADQQREAGRCGRPVQCADARRSRHARVGPYRPWPSAPTNCERARRRRSRACGPSWPDDRYGTPSSVYVLIARRSRVTRTRRNDGRYSSCDGRQDAGLTPLRCNAASPV